MRIIKSSDTRAIDRLLAPAGAEDRAFERRVQRIVEMVRTGGDRALARCAKRFDRVTGPIEVTPKQMRDAAATVDPAVRRAIAKAAANIAAVAARQIPKHFDVEVVPGVSVEQRVEPLARVGCYVPGGRFPLPSSLLMTAVPARVAGVAEVVVCCPRPEPAVMAAAIEAGVTRLFRLGGARAVAGRAVGTAPGARGGKNVGAGKRPRAAAQGDGRRRRGVC